MSTFSPPVSSVAAGFSPLVPFSLPNVPVLQQPFVVSQGFSPVPPKLVSPIISGKFVELSEFLSANIIQTQLDSDPQLFFNGLLVLTSTSKKPKRRMDDIGGCLEAFSVSCLVLTSRFRHCWKDLLLYQLLILRTHSQFTGRVWLAYDRASRNKFVTSQLLLSKLSTPCFLTQLHCVTIWIRNKYLAITLAKLGFLVAPLKLSPVGRG